MQQENRTGFIEEDALCRAVELAGMIADLVTNLPGDKGIETLNLVREILHNSSPFKDEPVDLITWVPQTDVYANDYNPNAVAPPEMELLALSILTDGYTQPIVTWPTEKGREVVDGFHRNRVAKENLEVNQRVKGYLPVVGINSNQSDKNDRIASTIRHNRARGKHQVEAMSGIVIELKRRNWANKRIAKELGMDADEVLRLCQITGLTDVFENDEFSNSWDAAIMSDDEIAFIDESDVTDDVDFGSRVFHEWQEWECYPAGFYSDHPPEGLSTEDCERNYRDFLADLSEFEAGLSRVLEEWPNSCEHYLTNDKMNRIAWLGQASMCLVNAVPARFCGGYNLLDDDGKLAADTLALKYLNIWLANSGREPVEMEGAGVKAKANIY